MYRRLPFLTCLALMAAWPAAMAGEAPGPRALAGRTITLPLPAGLTRIYLPAGHDPAKSWPLIVYLPGRPGDPNGSLAIWKKKADARGFVVAVPVPQHPDAMEGYADIVPVAMVRAAVQAASVDPRRTAIVGHLSAGSGGVRTVFDYPGLAAALVVVGSAPPRMRAAGDLVPSVPPLLFLLSDPRSTAAARKFAKDSPGLQVSVGQLPAARDKPGEPTVTAVLTWLGRQIKLGAGPASRPPAVAPDPAAAAKLLRRAAGLQKRGAEAGAYILLLRAARLDARSASCRLALARMCIDGRRVSEAIEWADAAAQIPGDAAPANLLASRALARTGRWREALERAALAGPAGKTLAAKLEAQRELLEKSDSSAALTHYRKARTAMKAGDYSRAADESRRAVALAPWEVVYRAFAVHAVCAVRGPSEGRKVLDDYLGLFPEDPYATAMADALKATIETDYSRPGLAARAQLMLGDVPEAAPPAAALTAMARRAGWERRPAELVGRLSASGASREMRMALPVLQQRGIPFKVGNGSLDDLRAKLAGDAPVLVQMPPGKLAGLRSGEKFSAGVPALVIGYDDGLRGVIVLEPGASKPRRIPYGLFDRLWSATDRWWLAIPPRGSSLPGKEGELTKLELGTALLASGGLRAASPLLEAELERHPRRAQLGMALLALARQQPDAARKRLSALSAAGPEYAIQVEHALGTLEDQLGEGPRADRLEKALPHYRAAWDLDPGVERSTLVLSAALLTRRKAGDVAEGRRILDDYLRFHPSSLAALRLYYSR